VPDFSEDQQPAKSLRSVRDGDSAVCDLRFGSSATDRDIKMRTLIHKRWEPFDTLIEQRRKAPRSAGQKKQSNKAGFHDPRNLMLGYELAYGIGKD
jgi:hypothetical protein